MQITREDLNPCTVKLEIVCDPEQVKQGFEKALRQAAKQVKLPGFRPGHAPRNMVEQYIGKEELAELALDNIVREAYKKAVEQEKLEPYSTGSVELKELDRDESKCEFTAKVPLIPKVEIGDYSSIPVEKPSIEISDQEIEEQIEDMRRRAATREVVTDRGVQEGDMAVVNVKTDGEEGDGRNFMTIAGKTFPQLDQALMGMSVEDMKVLDLNFPETFQEKDWAGKLLHCQVTLRALSSVKMPELDDEFAKSFKLENIDELKKRVGDLVKEAKGSAVQDFINEQLIDVVLQRSEICVPDTMWESVAKQKILDMAEQLQKDNKTLEDYAKEHGMTEEQLIEAQFAEAKTFVQRAQLIQEIFVKEDMKITNLELNQELMLMAREAQAKPEDLLSELKKNNAVQEIQYQAIHRKVMDFLNTKAETKEVARV